MRLILSLMALVLLNLCNLSFLNEITETASVDDIPPWIMNIDTQAVTNGWVVVEINEAYIWSLGDNRGRLEEQIAQTLIISINGQRLGASRILNYSPFNPPVNVYDDDGNLLGSYGEERIISFIAPSESGTYTVKIEIMRTTAEVLSHTWVLTVNRE